MVFPDQNRHHCADTKHVSSWQEKRSNRQGPQFLHYFPVLSLWQIRCGWFLLLSTWTEKQDFHFTGNSQVVFLFFFSFLCLPCFWGMIIHQEDGCFWTTGTCCLQLGPLLPWVCRSLMWSCPDVPAQPSLHQHKAALPCRYVPNSCQPTCTSLYDLGFSEPSPKTWKAVFLLAEGRENGHIRLLFLGLVPSLSLLVSARPFGQQHKRSQISAGPLCAGCFIPPEGCCHLDIWGKILISDVGRGKEPWVKVMPRTRLLQMCTETRFHSSFPQAPVGNHPAPLLFPPPPSLPPQCVGHLQNEWLALPCLGSKSPPSTADTTGSMQACVGQSWTVPEPFDRPSPLVHVPNPALLVPPLSLLGEAGPLTGECVALNSRRKDRWSED